MKKFKERWEIQHNWQLIFPLFGIISLVYSAYKLSFVFTEEAPLYISIILTAVVSFILLKVILFLFKKLEKKWVLTYKWEMIRVFLVFDITGSSSIFIGRPILKLIGVTKENLFPLVYWLLYISIGIIFYYIILLLIGWLFGQFSFFWKMGKKMIRRTGLGFLLKD